MKTLNERYDYGVHLYLLSIDEGITGYRDDSLEVRPTLSLVLSRLALIQLPYQTVKRNQQQYSMPLKILSYNDLYGWTMDAVVAQIGKKNNCTFCGVFRRQALDRGAAMLNVDHIVTGHNADDIAETVLMNSTIFLAFDLKLLAIELGTSFLSHARGYRSPGPVHVDMHTGGRHNQEV